MARRSDEQYKDLKFKVTIFTFLAIFIAIGVGVGPGLEPIFLERARKNMDKPWAATHMYRIARIEEMTFRRERAVEIYREIYINFAGDESTNEGIAQALAQIGKDEDDAELYFFCPWLATEYDLPGEEDENPRPNHQIGPKPHKVLAKALLQLALFHEDHKNYIKTRHLFPCLKFGFPGTEVASQAESALLRDVQRSF